LEEVDLRARDSRIARAQEPVEIAPASAEPCEAEQVEQRRAERRLREPWARGNRDRNAERAERGLEGCAPALERRTDDRDALGSGAAAYEREDLLADELERRAGARALEEANGAVECRRLPGFVDEQSSLDVRERGRRDLAEARREHGDPSVGERGKILERCAQRVECRTALLVRKRDDDVGPRGQRAQERPLRAREILEAVRE